MKLRKLRDLSFNEGDQGINGDVRQNKPNRLVIQLSNLDSLIENIIKDEPRSIYGSPNTPFVSSRHNYHLPGLSGNCFRKTNFRHLVEIELL